MWTIVFWNRNWLPQGNHCLASYFYFVWQRIGYMHCRRTYVCRILAAKFHVKKEHYFATKADIFIQYSHIFRRSILNKRGFTINRASKLFSTCRMLRKKIQRKKWRWQWIRKEIIFKKSNKNWLGVMIKKKLWTFLRKRFSLYTYMVRIVSKNSMFIKIFEKKTKKKTESKMVKTILIKVNDSVILYQLIKLKFAAFFTETHFPKYSRNFFCMNRLIYQ